MKFFSRFLIIWTSATMIFSNKHGVKRFYVTVTDSSLWRDFDLSGRSLAEKIEMLQLSRFQVLRSLTLLSTTTDFGKKDNEILEVWSKRRAWLEYFVIHKEKIPRMENIFQITNKKTQVILLTNQTWWIWFTNKGEASIKVLSLSVKSQMKQVQRRISHFTLPMCDYTMGVEGKFQLRTRLLPCFHTTLILRYLYSESKTSSGTNENIASQLYC